VKFTGRLVHKKILGHKDETELQLLEQIPQARNRGQTLLAGWHMEPQMLPQTWDPESAGNPDPTGPSGFQCPCQRTQRQTPESL